MNYEYRCQPVNFGYCVFENQTSQIIKSDLTLDEARKMSRKLNWGAGFDGFTPSFILKGIQL